MRLATHREQKPQKETGLKSPMTGTRVAVKPLHIKTVAAPFRGCGNDFSDN
jgi:hypothetical protein